MTILTALLVLLTCLLCLPGLAAISRSSGPDIMEPFVFSADFESGSVGAWSSYPPAQDTAYDPSIWVKKVEGRNGLCLVREVTPYTTDAHVFGVRRKVRITLDSASRLSFQYYVKSYTGASELVVKLGFRDGTSRQISVPVPSAMAWNGADLPLAAALEGAERRDLEAVAILAVCPSADPETKLRLAIDDFKISGLRPKAVTVDRPDVIALEELGVSVARDHVAQGSDLRFAGRFPLAVKSATIVLTHGWGDALPAVTHPVAIKGASWETTVRSRDLKPGLWSAVITGQADGGGSVEKTVCFLVRAAHAPADHPYLLATASDLERIRRAIESGHPRDVWEGVKREAAGYREKFSPDKFRYNLDAYDEIFWLPTYEGYVRALHTPSRFIRENGIVYAVSGDKAAGEAARQALLRIAEWPSFVHPHILNQGQFTYWPVGLALIDFAMGYDLVYDLLTPAERQTVARALYSKGVTEVFKEYVRDNRVSSNTSNWISHVTGGGLLCALAIRREIPEAELEPYLTGMIVKLREFIEHAFDPDGYYGEGYYYHNFAMQSLCHSLPALEKSFGIEPPAAVMNSFRYLLYQQDTTTGRIYEFGDAHDDLIPSSMSNFSYVLLHDNNPLLRWLYEQRPGDNYLDLLFAPGPGRAEPPAALPLIGRLRRVGSTIFRSGFGHDDFVFVFKCGPFFNHQHFDQGSFFLADRGQVFIEECGNSNYYEDPWYPRLYIQAGGHNCPLTDGKVESQRSGDFDQDVRGWRDFARTTDFLETENAAFLSADLTPVYKGAWKSLRRSLIFLKPRAVVIIDQGEGGAGVQTLGLRFHAPRKDDISLEKGGASIARGGRALAIQTVYPADFDARSVKRPMSLNEFKAEDSITMKARGFLELSTRLRDGAAGFVNVLSTDEDLAKSARCTDKTDHLELLVAGRRFLINKPGGREYQAEDIQTDASILEPFPSGFVAARASRVATARRLVIESSQAGTFRYAETGRRLSVSFSVPEKTTIRIMTAGRPKTVSAGGGRPINWRYEEGRVVVSPSASEGTLEIEF